ncbi:hypothetical protein Aph01nite_69830 [Acrocarpospora phusangensis]|uniref:Uncharacterized protein n=2 Tax=Acrocarpospora phusangensis TaxID=1070424 RepID=A0A919QH25_9ACTN|nr:hypothetical protein Aph01nite_69830 [Acrocarpospora phusangensis]
MITERQGLVPGIVAGAVFGAFYFAGLVWSRETAVLYRRHPWLNTLPFTGTFFVVVVALNPEFTLLRCAIMALIAGAIFGGLIALVQRYRERTTV